MLKNKGIMISHGTVLATISIMMLGIYPTIMAVKAQVPGLASSSANPSSPPLPPTSTTFRGAIASIQNNNQGKPNWIAQGQWNMSLVKPNQRQLKLTANSFNSTFTMEMINGSEKHKHSIYNFRQTGSSMNTTAASPSIINGTATITMNKGTIQNVPITIKLWQGNALNLWIDPASSKKHFGNTPIYGTIYKRQKP
jgi:hypothetical protein